MSVDAVDTVRGVEVAATDEDPVVAFASEFGDQKAAERFEISAAAVRKRRQRARERGSVSVYDLSRWSGRKEKRRDELDLIAGRHWRRSDAAGIRSSDGKNWSSAARDADAAADAAARAAMAAREHEVRLSDVQNRVFAAAVSVVLEAVLGEEEMGLAARAVGRVLKQCDEGLPMVVDPLLSAEINGLRETRVAAVLEPMVRRRVTAELEVVYARRVADEVQARLDALEGGSEPRVLSEEPSGVETVDGVEVESVPATGRLAAQLEAERVQDEALAAEEAKLERGEIQLTAREVAIRIARGESARRREQPPDPPIVRSGDIRPAGG